MVINISYQTCSQWKYNCNQLARHFRLAVENSLALVRSLFITKGRERLPTKVGPALLPHSNPKLGRIRSTLDPSSNKLNTNEGYNSIGNRGKSVNFGAPSSSLASFEAELLSIVTAFNGRSASCCLKLLFLFPRTSRLPRGRKEL